MFGKDDLDSPVDMSDIIIAEFDSSSAGGQRANMEFARELSNQRGIDLDIIGRHIRREACGVRTGTYLQMTCVKEKKAR